MPFIRVWTSRRALSQPGSRLPDPQKLVHYLMAEHLFNAPLPAFQCIVHDPSGVAADSVQMYPHRDFFIDIRAKEKAERTEERLLKCSQAVEEFMRTECGLHNGAVRIEKFVGEWSSTLEWGGSNHK